MDLLSNDQLKQIAHASNDKLRGIYLPLLNAVFIKYRINSPLRIAAFLAQIIHESEYFIYTEELASGSDYEERSDLGNLEPWALAAAHAHGSTTGKFYKGHGILETTGAYNHKEVGEALGLDLVNNPRLLCLPEHATESAAWFWVKHNLNVYADVGNFEMTSHRINGGKLGKANGEVDRNQLYALGRRVLRC